MMKEFVCSAALMAGALSCVSAETKDIEIIAHRGASYNNPKVTSGTLYAPENTIAANKLAWAMNADAVECDVHLSADGRVMVSHDGQTTRTSGGKVNLNIAKSTSEELRKIDLGSFYDKRYADEKMPYLEELIELVPPGKKLYVEIKCGKEAVAPINDIFNKSGKRKQMAIIGFDLETMGEAAKVMPDVPVYYLRGGVVNKETKKVMPHSLAYIKQVKDLKINGLDMSWDGCSAEFCKAVREAGLGLVAWTVDDPKEAQRLASIGINGLTTNRPDLMLEILRTQK